LKKVEKTLDKSKIFCYNEDVKKRKENLTNQKGRTL